ncbi:MAG TPA: CoA transferase, partial [Mycobacterium sp.]|nr:CoA transferase [Mycobacterium sp.]
VAMYDVAVALQANQLTVHLNRTAASRPAPNTKKRKSVGFATQPSDAFRTADGWIVISAYVPKHWAALCHIIGREDLIDDERFADQRSRSINYAELTEELEATLTTRTAAEWVDTLHDSGLMACLPYTWKQVVHTALFAENQLALPIGDGDDAVTVVRTPARYSTFSAAATGPPPAPGQHNDELLP